MDEAIHPTVNPVVKIYGELKDEQEKSFNTLRDKEEQWARFTASEFYYLIKEYIEHLNESLENLEGAAWENNASSDELVIRRAVMKLTKANLLSLIKKADGSRDTRSDQGGNRKESTLS